MALARPLTSDETFDLSFSFGRDQIDATDVRYDSVPVFASGLVSVHLGP